MCEYLLKFSADETKLKNYVKDMAAHQLTVENALIAVLNEIKVKYMGKSITQRVANSINKNVLTDSPCYIEITNNDSRQDEKVMEVCFKDKNMSYRVLSGDVCVYVSFAYSEVLASTCSIDNKFDESSIDAIANIINLNRKRLAMYQDAAKNVRKQWKKMHKAVDKFLKAMETSNPIFFEYNAANNLYNYRRFDFTEYQNDVNSKVTLFVA